MKTDKQFTDIASQSIVGLGMGAGNICWVDVIPCSYLWDDWEASFGMTMVFSCS